MFWRPDPAAKRFVFLLFSVEITVVMSPLLHYFGMSPLHQSLSISLSFSLFGLMWRRVTEIND